MCTVHLYTEHHWNCYIMRLLNSLTDSHLHPGCSKVTTKLANTVEEQFKNTLQLRTTRRLAQFCCPSNKVKSVHLSYYDSYYVSKCVVLYKYFHICYELIHYRSC